MRLKEKTVWRVQSGGDTRWFPGERNAREFASDRYEVEFDGIPFVREIALTEALARLNELESSK